MPVIPANRVVDTRRIIGKNGGPRRRRSTRGHWPPKKQQVWKADLLEGRGLCNAVPPDAGVGLVEPSVGLRGVVLILKTIAKKRYRKWKLEKSTADAILEKLIKFKKSPKWR
jgi:hypothetical protein